MIFRTHGILLQFIFYHHIRLKLWSRLFDTLHFLLLYLLVKLVEYVLIVVLVHFLQLTLTLFLQVGVRTSERQMVRDQTSQLRITMCHHLVLI